MNERGQTIAEVSEAQLLDLFVPSLASADRDLVGPGDDAAIISIGTPVVASTDSMVRGVDWRDDWSSAYDVGGKVAVQNIADIAAMGATTTSLLVSLAADPGTPVAWVRELSDGIDAVARAAGCTVVGGDLSSAPRGTVVITVTALGELQGHRPVLRSGARVGDVVAVAGSLGRSGAGLLLLQRGMPDGELTAYHRRPRPPWEAGPQAAQAGATAMIDISDGLTRDGDRIARASSVELDLDGAVLRQYFLRGPIEAALGAEAGWREVLSGGEEHSLLATFDRQDIPCDQGGRWLVIGEVKTAGATGPRLVVDGEVPPQAGWDHFSG